MKNPYSGFRTAAVSLWFRLMSLAIVGLVFAEALLLAPGKVQNWTYYITTSEVVFEIAVRLIFAALAGIALGTVCTGLLSPFLWRFPASRQRLTEWATKVGVVLVVFADSRLALTDLIKWSNRGIRFTPKLLVAHFLIFVIVLCIPRSRKEVVTSLDGFLSEKMTRRTAVATVVGAAALIGTEFAGRRRARTVVAALAPPRPKSNFLLITFDALSAEDMSLYGYTLPTTPNLDAFAGKSTVFTNFYAASTFTTSSIAAIMTGSYPSENHVYQVEGRVSAKESGKNLPHAMRAGGYTPGAFLSNPFAYYLVQSAKSEYDFLPEPIFQPGGLHNLWEATRPLHQDSGIGNRLDEYRDLERVWNSMGVLPESQSFRLRPAVSFGKGREILAQSPDGFSLWIHVMAPHFPYLPDVEDRGRFLPYDEQLTFQEEEGARWRPYYEPDQQGEVDRRRLLYDEYILSTDRAFGAFVAELEKDGILQNTTVIISADHGESFEGGVYQHESAYQTRPVIHIPLIIRTPGQQAGRRVAFTADHTALAPTILELAGQPIPDWMRGESLVKWLQGNGQGEGEGRAFTQFLQRNSVFKAPRHGTVGVIDGKSQHQYVLDLETQKGSLRPLKEAHIWNLDRTAENPALAQALREAIYLRFPDLVQKP